MSNLANKLNIVPAFVEGQTTAKLLSPAKAKAAPTFVSKEEASKQVGPELACVREAGNLISKMTEGLIKSVNGNADFNLSHIDECKAVLEHLDECKRAAQRIQKVVQARCRSRLNG